MEPQPTNPTNQQIRELLNCYQSNHFAHAEKLALSLTKKFPDNQFGWKLLGAVLKKTNRVKESLVFSQKAVHLAPSDAEAHNNLGNTLKELDRLSEAEDCLRRAIKLRPNFAEAYNNLGITLHELRNLEEAEKALRKATHLKLNYIEAHYNLGNILTELNKLEDAKTNYKKAIKEKPDFAAAHNNLGNTYKKLGKIQKAKTSYNKAIKSKSDFAEPYNNIGNLLKEQGRLEEAEASYKKSVAIKPDFVEALNNLGDLLQKRGRLEESERCLKRAIDFKSNFAEAYNNLGVVLNELKRLEEAVASYKKAISFRFGYAKAHNNLGNTLYVMGRLFEAEVSYQRALELKTDYAEAYNNLGITLKALGKPEDAELNFRKAIALKCDYPEAHSNLGVILKELGRFKEAEDSYKKAVNIKPDFAEAHRHLASVKTFYKHDTQFLKMLNLSSDPSISEEQRCHLSFGLAKAFEDLGNLEKAYKYFAQGNSIRKKHLSYDIGKDIELFKQIKNSYRKIKKHSIQKEAFSSKLTPIFIVGMPRSGTTLVEQIISSHSLISAAGELPFVSQLGDSVARGISSVSRKTILNFRKNYLNELRDLSKGRFFVTDKTPQNFCYLGLISAAFPEAKIVHVMRSAAAVCWANYKQYFAHQSIGYCYALNDIVQYYQLYDNLMQYWEKLHHDRIYNINYELLTSNQEIETRKLIKYLNLNWEKKCLSPEKNKRSVATASNMQVRNKVYQGSSQQWTKFKPFLEGAFDSLIKKSGYQVK